MKWAFAVQRKLRVAIMLALMMLVIIVFSIWESYNVNRMARSFHSIYEDRLIPAVDLYFIADQIHGKRNYLFTFLFTNEINEKEVKNHLENSNRRLDSVIAKYSNTLLVKEEFRHLQTLKINLKNFRRDELVLLNAAHLDKALAGKLYLKTTVNLHDELTENLRQLTHVQTEVGKTLLAESEKTKASSLFITQLLLIIAIILGGVITILIITGKQVLLRQENYKLN